MSASLLKLVARWRSSFRGYEQPVGQSPEILRRVRSRQGVAEQVEAAAPCAQSEQTETLAPLDVRVAWKNLTRAMVESRRGREIPTKLSLPGGGEKRFRLGTLRPQLCLDPCRERLARFVSQCHERDRRGHCDPQTEENALGLHAASEKSTRSRRILGMRGPRLAARLSGS